MSKYIFLLFGLWFTFTLPAKINVDQEYIRNFRVMVKVDTSGELEVTETITVNALGDQIKRGIKRFVPTSRRTTEGSFAKTPVEIINVSHNGSKSDYHTENESGNLAIYIGSKDIIIPNGVHQYEIVYKTRNQIGFYDNYDEIYWNVTGNEWDFPIQQVSCQVFLPKGAKIIQKACYTGVQGAKEYKCRLGDENDEYLNFNAENLNKFEGLTVAVGFTKGFVQPPPPPTWWEIWRIRVISLFALIVMFVYYFYSWGKYGKDPESPVVYPMYSPPESLTLSEIGMVERENYSSRFMTATMLQWAVRGFIQIKDETKSYLFNIIKSPKFVLTKLKEPDKSFSAHESKLFSKLFGSKEELVIDGEYNETIYTASSKFEEDTKSLYNESLGKGKNYKYVVIASLIFVAAAILMVVFDKESSFIFIMAPFFVMVFMVPFFIAIFGKLTDWLNVRLFNKIVIWLILVPSTLLVTFIWEFSMNMNDKVLLCFLIIGMASLFVYAQLIKRPSEEKLKLQAEIDGFKMYLKMAENERVKLLNPPDETPELFEKYLPFAVLFKVEEVWGERFKDLLSKDPQQPGYSAGWYSGSNFSQFTNSVASSGFRSAMDNSSGKSSSYSSGSGGGGFSGGGGGGGGGGGW